MKYYEGLNEEGLKKLRESFDFIKDDNRISVKLKKAPVNKLDASDLFDKLEKIRNFVLAETGQETLSRKCLIQRTLNRFNRRVSKPIYDTWVYDESSFSII